MARLTWLVAAMIALGIASLAEIEAQQNTRVVNLTAQSELPKIWTGVYTTAQAELGKAVFQKTCMTCHNFDMKGTEGRGPALVGDPFMANWETENVAALFTRMQTTMPRNNPASLTEEVYLDLLAYILQSNGYPDGAVELTAAAFTDLQIVKRDGTGKKAVPNFAMVEMVGCLAQSNNRWMLTRSSEPLATKDLPSSDADLQASAARPLGLDEFRLVAVNGFDPARHYGQKVHVKGLLYRRPNDNRLNVTSLRSVASSCSD